MLKISKGSGASLGARHDVCIQFPVEFEDGLRGEFRLYYPVMEVAVAKYVDEIEVIRAVAKKYTFEEYKDLLLTNCFALNRQYADDVELFTQIHRWERELWGLPMLSI
jgi:hypothetical protein